MEKWAIQTKGFQESDDFFEYYTGESYVVNGELYISSDRDSDMAKIYSSENRAISAMRKIRYNFSNSWAMRVVKIQTEKKDEY